MAINFDFGSGAKKSGHLDYPFQSYGPKQVRLISTHPWDIQTIVDHCPQNFENHRKTIDTNGWALKKHSMVMVQRCQNHRKTIEVNGGLKKTLTIPSL